MSELLGSELVVTRGEAKCHTFLSDLLPKQSEESAVAPLKLAASGEQDLGLLVRSS